METRAHHLLIGLFVIIVIVALFGFILWLARGDFDRDLKAYEIYFEGSVAGLSTGAAVQFNGVPVGTIADIQIVPDRPQVVRVIVRVDEDVPVNTDTVATLEAQGFTGVAIVHLRGGSPEAPPLKGQNGGRPVIASERSGLQELFEGAPELVNAANDALNNVNALISNEMKDHIKSIVASTDTILSSIASQSGELEKAIAEIDDTLIAYRSLAEEAEKLVKTADAVTAGELRATLVQAEQTLASADALLTRVDDVIMDNEDAIRTFVNNTLPEATRLMADLRRLTITMRHIVETFQEDPTQVLFGEPKPASEESR